MLLLRVWVSWTEQAAAVQQQPFTTAMLAVPCMHLPMNLLVL